MLYSFRSWLLFTGVYFLPLLKISTHISEKQGRSCISHIGLYISWTSLSKLNQQSASACAMAFQPPWQIGGENTAFNQGVTDGQGHWISRQQPLHNSKKAPLQVLKHTLISIWPEKSLAELILLTHAVNSAQRNDSVHFTILVKWYDKSAMLQPLTPRKSICMF